MSRLAPPPRCTIPPTHQPMWPGLWGTANIVKGQAGALRGEQVEFAAPGGSAGFLRRGYSFAPGQEVTLAIRGEQAQAVKGAEGPGLAGVVKEKSFAGGMLRIAVELAGGGEFSLQPPRH